MSRKFFVSAVAGAAVLVGVVSLNTTAKADSSTSIGLSATVLDACDFGNVTDISFATDYEPGQTSSLAGTGSFVVACTVAAQSVTLTPDAGGSGGGSFGRRLVHDTDNSELLDYNLLISEANVATTSAIFTAATAFTRTLANGDNTFTLDAIISASQSAIGGDYGDNVGIVMSF